VISVRETKPKFRGEAEERVFSESHDTGDYFDLSNAQKARSPNQKRPPEGLLDRVKIATIRRDMAISP
jgi:CopG antitoxin of type II toxin-antitoxin system